MNDSFDYNKFIDKIINHEKINKIKNEYPDDKLLPTKKSSS